MSVYDKVAGLYRRVPSIGQEVEELRPKHRTNAGPRWKAGAGSFRWEASCENYGTATEELGRDEELVLEMTLADAGGGLAAGTRLVVAEAEDSTERRFALRGIFKKSVTICRDVCAGEDAVGNGGGFAGGANVVDAKDMGPGEDGRGVGGDGGGNPGLRSETWGTQRLS